MVKKGLASLKTKPYVFMPVQSGYGSTSLDFLACIGGRFVAIETKANVAKQLTPRQISTRDYIHQAGGKVFVVYDQPSCDAMVAELILMLEHDPNVVVPRLARHPVLQAYLYPEEQAADQQHLRQQFANETPDPAARGDHGAPAEPPPGHPLAAARGDDQ